MSLAKRLWLSRSIPITRSKLASKTVFILSSVLVEFNIMKLDRKSFTDDSMTCLWWPVSLILRICKFLFAMETNFGDSRPRSALSSKNSSVPDNNFCKYERILKMPFLITFFFFKYVNSMCGKWMHKLLILLSRGRGGVLIVCNFAVFLLLLLFWFFLETFFGYSIVHTCIYFLIIVCNSDKIDFIWKRTPMILNYLKLNASLL